MADTIFVKEAAKLWNISERRVSTLCKEGKIKGAIKQGKSWLIPANTEKPTDNRIKSGIYKKVVRPANLPLPIGISDYRLASSEYYYIDKTMMIKDFIDSSQQFKPQHFCCTIWIFKPLNKMYYYYKNRVGG